MEKSNELFVLWTNADLMTSEHMVMMYITNAIKRGWWEKITLIVWGATSKLVAENEDIQLRIRDAQDLGIHVSACIACARNLGTTEKLQELDIELISWGVPLTEIIKEGKHLITI